MNLKKITIKADDVPIVENADIEIDFSNNNNLEDILIPYMSNIKSVEIDDKCSMISSNKIPVTIGQKIYGDMVVTNIWYEKKPWWKFWKKKKQIAYRAEKQ